MLTKYFATISVTTDAANLEEAYKQIEDAMYMLNRNHDVDFYCIVDVEEAIIDDN